MINDRLIKTSLLKYFIRRFWYPQLEVDVLSKERVSTNRKLITDVDVLGLYPDVTGQLKTILGDCKTLKGQSPITRSLWMKGLMEYLEADKGIILLKKNIEKDHQFTSSFMGIQLLSDSDFEIYSKHTSDQIIEIKSALAEIDNWDKFFEISKKFPRLNDLLKFAKSDFWNELKSTNRLRYSILNLRSHRKELNPDNKLHLAVCLNHFSLVAIALNDIISNTFSRYLIPDSKQAIDEDLKSLIWGGIDNYNYLNDLRRKFIGGQPGSVDLSLPKWETFLEMVRVMLEKPLVVSYLPLFLKEAAFTFLSEKDDLNYLKEISIKNQYIITYAIHMTDYLVKSSDLPSEFQDIYSTKFGTLIS